MFGWRKKRDGFEWHEYVRTTILVRRAKRRQKVDDVRHAAVHGLKDAGAAAAHGLKDAGAAAAHGLKDAKGAAAEGLRRAGAAGAAAGASGAGMAGNMLQGLWSGSRRTFAALNASGASGVRAAASVIAGQGAALLAPLLIHLSDRRARIIVGGLGVLALIALAYRIWVIGFDGRAVAIAAVAALTLGPALLAERHREDATHRVAAGRAAASSQPATFSMRMLGPVLGWGAMAALLIFGIGAMIGPGGYATGPAGSAITTAALPQTKTPTPARPSIDGDIFGRASALSGDTLRIGRRVIKLDHIEAPERSQTCTRDNGRSWDCGEAARSALARMVGRSKVGCTLTGESNGLARGDCRIGTDDLAASLVREGHVFAGTGFFARHSGLEDDARAAHRGLWSGNAQRPDDFRAAAWKAALQNAPDSCPIKGRIASRTKLYVMPWMRGYDSIKIRTSRGERWFCSEEEAREAGWRPASAS